ncbi:hypothetical protein GF391_03815|nr:hypothetical protein [Candidatus Uhrbacteria bacterium]
MQESSNPPVEKEATIPCSAPVFCSPSSSPPSEQVVIEDHSLRDVLVRLCRPTLAPNATDPRKHLVLTLIESFSKQGNSLDEEQVVRAVDVIIARELIKYDVASGCFRPTIKTQEIMHKLYIVICGDCGASNIIPKPGDDGLREMISCHHCGEFVK